jgi:hypothetical protein
VKSVEKLITLEEDEEILEIYKDKDSTYRIEYKNIDQDHHKIEDLPTSFFNITEKNISFKETHIFTNKRYISVGINFWQLYDSNCKKNLDKIKIENFILSIKREYLQTIKFELKGFENTIILGDMVKFPMGMFELKKFLIEQWNFPQSEIDLKEHYAIFEKAKSFRILCSGEIISASITILVNLIFLIFLDENYAIRYFNVIFLSIMIILSIIELLSLRTEPQINKYLGSEQSRQMLFYRSTIFILISWGILGLTSFYLD